MSFLPGPDKWTSNSFAGPWVTLRTEARHKGKLSRKKEIAWVLDDHVIVKLNEEKNKILSYLNVLGESVISSWI